MVITVQSNGTSLLLEYAEISTVDRLIKPVTKKKVFCLTVLVPFIT